MARVFIAIGSNIEPEVNVRKGLAKLAARIPIRDLSTFYRTQPLARPGQDPFINGVVELETGLGPRELKDLLRKVEVECGRVRSEDKHAPRTLDLDVIVYDELAIHEGSLTLPDPEIAERPFLAIPLAELAPGLTLPGDGRPMSELAKAHADHGMEPLATYTESLRESTSHGPRES